MTESPMSSLSPSPPPSHISLDSSVPETRALELATIPTPYQMRIPPTHLSILALLENYSLPMHQISHSLRDSPLSAFSKEPPILGPFSLGDLALPYSGPNCMFLPTLTKNLHKRMEKGSKSVHINDIFLPMWVVTFWKYVLPATDAHVKWTEAKRWFEDSILTKPLHHPFSGLANSIPEFLHRSPWAGKLVIGTRQIPTLELAELFASHGISDTLVDSVMHLIQRRVDQSSSEKRRILVLDLTVSWALHLPVAQWKNYESEDKFQAIRQTGSRIKDEGIKVVFFPFFVRNNHWVVFEIDFEQKSISYADSCQLPVARNHISAVRRWLALMQFKKFSYKLLPTAIQDDAHSCGVIVWNTIEARIFSDPLWISGLKDSHRASYALRLMEASEQSSFIPVPVSNSFNFEMLVYNTLIYFIAFPSESLRSCDRYFTR